MNSSARTWLGIIASIIVIGLMIWSMPLYFITPKGVVLPADGDKPAYTGPVNIYDQLDVPFSAETIGVINMRYHTLSSSLATQETLVNKAKEIAAAAGANGIVASIGSTYPNTPTGLRVMVLSGKVVRTSDSHN